MKLLILSSSSGAIHSPALLIWAGSILFSLSIARGQNLFVSGYGSGTVEEFTPNGSDKIVATGLNEPMGIAFDAAGNLYVANYWSDTIDKFNSSGVGGVFASTGGGYSNPLGLACANGLLYVSVADNQIEQFNASGVGGYFASTENGPWFMAVQAVPESSAFSWLAGGSCTLLILSFSKKPSHFCASMSVAKPLFQFSAFLRS